MDATASCIDPPIQFSREAPAQVDGLLVAEAVECPGLP
jgi:hypothetical protein